MKFTVSKRVLTVICAVALISSVINTVLIFDLHRALRDAWQDSEFDYVIFQNGSTYGARNQATGSTDISSTDASLVINQAIDKATSVYMETGNYTLDSNVQIRNKQNAKIISNGACIIGNGNLLIVKGDDYTYSQNNMLSGLTVTNCTVKIENSFGTTISDMLFENCSTGLEFTNTKTWSEGTKIEDCRFINCRYGIVFKTPGKNTTTSIATGSYASTEIRRCYFNLPNDSAGIIVEQEAELSDSQIQNVRMWMGENGYERNQTGLLVEGTMHQTLLFGVVFESFAQHPDGLYAIVLGETSVTPPILAGGVSFLGENWTARIHNPYYRWIAGSGSIFRKEDLAVTIGLDGQYSKTEEISIDPLTISTFESKIRIYGSFINNETVTVRYRLKFLDNTVSNSVEKSFTDSTTIWLSDDDLMEIYPSQSIIWKILVDAKANSSSTAVTAKVSVYGTAT